MPDSISTKGAALFYVGLVNFGLLYQTRPERRDTIIRALGGDDHDVEFWRHPQPEGNFVEWAAKKMGKTSLLMALTLGDVLGIKPEYAFNRFPASSDAPSKARLARRPFDFPRQMVVHDTAFTIKAIDMLRDYCHDDIQYAVNYTSPCGDILLVFANRDPTSDGADIFRIGFRSPDAFLPSREWIDASPSAPVFLCLDPAVTLKMRQLAREARLLERCGVIVSGLYGGQSEVDAMDWTPLAFREVVILASPGQPGWVLADAVVKRCRDVRADMVRVWPWPIIVDGLSPDISALPIKARDPMTSMMVEIEHIEVPSALMARIKNEAIPSDDLQHWREDMGLQPQSTSADAATVDKGRLDIKTYDELPAMPMRSIGSPVKVDEMFNAVNTTLIYGASNSGKSWLTIQLAIAIACGRDFFFLEGSSPKRVLYIDGEIGNGFRQRIDQLVCGDHGYSELIRKNFFAMLERGLRISEPKAFEQLMRNIRERKPEHVIFDNVFSLTPEAAKGSANKLFGAVHQIEALGVGVTILHHTTKSRDAFKGPYELEALCQNVIVLQDRETIKDKLATNTIPDVVKSALQKPGPVARMIVKKCKVAPEFERMERFLVLEVNGCWTMYDSDGRRVEGGTLKATTSEAVEANPPQNAVPFTVKSGVEISASKADNSVEPDKAEPDQSDVPSATPVTALSDVTLTPDSQRVFDFMSQGKAYTRPGIDALWNGITPGAAKNRSLKALKPLLKKGIVTFDGTGRSRWYMRP